MSTEDLGSATTKLVIEHVQPSLDGGRYAVKHVVGDTCRVGADIYRDGHDLLAARVRYKAPRSRSWRSVRMRYDYDNDRWYGEFQLDVLGTWRFTVEAWTDLFATWRDALEKKVAANLEVSVELLEGWELLKGAETLAGATDSRQIANAAKAMTNARAAVADRIDAALSPELAKIMDGLVDPGEITRHDVEYRVVVDRPSALFAAWYEMFPRSQVSEQGEHGTFRDAARALPRIANLGFDVVYLPPIHPVGTSFRKGRNNTLVAQPGDPGSPWAIGSEDGGHTAVAPELGTIADFDRFVRTAEGLGLDIALDYALQCSPDHPWVKEHPEWFVHRPDGTIMYAENPPKKYQDIYPINFWCDDREDLWHACKEIVEFWIAHGVKTFRVDNPHTKPLAFWEWMIASVKDKHPETIFLAEAFTRPKKMWGLAKLGFTQSYTHFTWKNTSYELRELFTQLHGPELAPYFRGNLFVNTPDILHAYLQKGGRPAFRVRLLLAATLSPLYGIYSGYEICENEPREPGSEEYLESEKYQIKMRDWDVPGNINDDIRLINRIRRENAALQTQGNCVFHQSDNENLLFFSRTVWGNDLLIVVNLDPHNPQDGIVHVPVSQLSLGLDEEYRLQDLLTGEGYTWRSSGNYVRLDPAEKVGHVFRIER
jgi:starch synthase (maltosyl-transferring)